MSRPITFKTSEECRVELVAHTVLVDHHDDAFTDADWLPVSAARASFQREDKTGESILADLKLLKHLVDEEHFGVFEHNTATILVECPIFVARQIQRHRTASYNEWSRRYTDQNISFWIPDKWRKQSTSNKQASADNDLPYGDFGLDAGSGIATVDNAFYEFKRACRNSLQVYTALLDGKVCREQARAVLPQSLITQFYMTSNLRNWTHFLKLRLDEHAAQKEVQVVARKVHRILFDLWPEPVRLLVGEPE